MKISILIPAYNAEKYLRECLESVIVQTYSDLQIVIIDDGSSDNTLSILNEYAETDSRIEVYTQENSGVAVTRNNLLDKAKGEYTLFVDADDWMEPEMVEALIGLITTTGVDIAMCGHINQHEDKTLTPHKNNPDFKIWTSDEILKKFLLHRELTGALWNKLVRTCMWHKFTPGIAYGEDAMVIWQVLLKASKMAVTSNQYYNYRMNPESVSHSGGLTKKMSVIPVWESIITSTPNAIYKKMAESRYGAEISLVLYSEAYVGTSGKNLDIKNLRAKLRKLIPHMIKGKTLSYKFLCFSIIEAYNWEMAKLLCR